MCDGEIATLRRYYAAQGFDESEIEKRVQTDIQHNRDIFYREQKVNREFREMEMARLGYYMTKRLKDDGTYEDDTRQYPPGHPLLKVDDNLKEAKDRAEKARRTLEVCRDAQDSVAFGVILMGVALLVVGVLYVGTM